MCWIIQEYQLHPNMCGIIYECSLKIHSNNYAPSLKHHWPLLCCIIYECPMIFAGKYQRFPQSYIIYLWIHSFVPPKKDIHREISIAKKGTFLLNTFKIVLIFLGIESSLSHRNRWIESKESNRAKSALWFSPSSYFVQVESSCCSCQDPKNCWISTKG